jgi:uncharacterized protein (DUF952 family)
MLIYKILTADQWQALKRDGESPGAPLDIADGFVHFSTAAQVAGTAAKHFAGQGGLMLLAVEAARLGPALKWEPARGGDLFPHLYAPLRRADLAWAKPLPLGSQGVHLIPEDVA